MAFALRFSPDALDHLRSLSKRDHQVLLDSISAQLAHQPDTVTAKRKRLNDNPIAPWELRVGDFRVFYDIRNEGAVVVICGGGPKGP